MHVLILPRETMRITKIVSQSKQLQTNLVVTETMTGKPSPVPCISAPPFLRAHCYYSIQRRASTNLLWKLRIFAVLTLVLGPQKRGREKFLAEFRFGLTKPNRSTRSVDRDNALPGDPKSLNIVDKEQAEIQRIFTQTDAVKVTRRFSTLLKSSKSNEQVRRG